MPLSPTQLDRLLDYTFQNNSDNLVLNLSATLNSPSGATFTTTITGGVVNSLAVALSGSGYPDGTYNLSFVGGSPSVTASGTAVATGGKIQSVTLADGGSGYGSAPAANLFAPEKQISFITPTNKTPSPSDAESYFNWFNPTSLTTPVELIFPTPSQTLTTVPIAVPSGFLIPVRSEGAYSTWRIQIASTGYGYTTVPSISHKPMIAAGVSASVVRVELPEGTQTIKRIRGGQSNQLSSRSIIVNNGGFLPRRLAFEINDFDSLQRAFNNPQAQTYPSGIWGVSGLRQEYLSVAFYESPSWVLNKRQNVSGANTTDKNISDLFIYGQLESSSILDLIKQSYGVEILFVVEQLGGTRPTKHCVGRITYGQSDPSYNIKIYTGGLGQVQPGGNAGQQITTLGGGMLAPTLEIIDAGSGYTSGLPVRLKRISGVANPGSFSNNIDADAVAGQITVATSNYFDSAISYIPSVVTRISSSGNFELAVGNSGLGFASDIEISVPQKTYTDAVVSASITNLSTVVAANAYFLNNATSQCEVQSPASGIKAQLLFVASNPPRVTIVCPGSGYTSAPIVTAPAPSGKTQFGKISISELNSPKGYRFDKEYPLEISPSPVSGGNAAGFFNILDLGFGNQFIDAKITNAGFGYITRPTITAPAPDALNHYISSIQLTNTPEGYTDGQTYSLEIGSSPVTGGTAKASLTKLNASSYLVTIDEAGYGYSSGVPVVTAPGPDVKQGRILAITTTTSGKGYAPGVYEVSVDSAPAGGENATAELEVQSNGVALFRPINSGFGYVTAPNASAITPIGNLISGITITCQGTFYVGSTAQFTIDDPGGQGANLGKAFISNGKITGINVIDGGYGFTNTPKITFNPPTPPAEKVYPPNTVVKKFNITTASANAILTTANQRDVLLEVYETDGTNEQVVVQGTVNLAKRVLE